MVILLYLIRSNSQHSTAATSLTIFQGDSCRQEQTNIEQARVETVTPHPEQSSTCRQALL